MLVVVGELVGLNSREVGSGASVWVKREVSLLVGRDRSVVQRVTLSGRDLADFAAERGEVVALEVSVETYSKFDKRTNAYSGDSGHELKAWRRLPEVEQLAGVGV